MISLPKIPAWVGDAPCAQIDPELFFPTKGDYNTANRAKRVCQACPVRAECLTTAIEDPGLDGVWGGTTPRERTEIRTDPDKRKLVA